MVFLLMGRKESSIRPIRRQADHRDRLASGPRSVALKENPIERFACFRARFDRRKGMALVD
jgi:hypothetical protein